MSDEGIKGGECSSTVIYKRPLFPLHKYYNEIYITSRTPQCVYFKRAIQLLDWQLSCYTSLCSAKFLTSNRVNQKTGVMSNRSKLLSKCKDGVNASCDSCVTSATFSKRPVSIVDEKRKGIILYGSGRCVNKALFVLHDIYEYVKDLYLDAQSRFNKDGRLGLCADKLQPCTESCIDPSQSTSGRARCDLNTSANLERAVKEILKVEISTGTVTCRDDVYIYTIEGREPLSLERFSPLAACDSRVSSSCQERLISSIKICIDVAGT